MIKIVKADKSGWKTIAGFQIAMAKESENLILDKKTVELGVKAVFKDSARGQYYVAMDGKKIIASLMITYEWSDWRNRVVWWIQSVYVIPEYRKQKVFRMMYSYLQNLVNKNAKVGGLRLYVDKTNQNAISVYQKIQMNGEHYQLFEWMKS
ncbi:MAG: GNAT family N-acetyltransferase [Bacteriovoracaceae bacterium]|nr:GNAT family N-acetyltransferase [Bacteriovoracaceae bacterium]